MFLHGTLFFGTPCKAQSHPCSGPVHTVCGVCVQYTLLKVSHKVLVDNDMNKWTVEYIKLMKTITLGLQH